MALAPGTRLGPYEISSPLGSGGMGEVYRARDPRLGRDVAIKVVLGSAADDPVAHDRFEREARAVAALAHPNILAVFDVGAEGGVTFVVTELLQGETLRQRIEAGGPLPPRRALAYAAQAAHGLAAAHERGIVHRDLKPENLFLTADGRLKILDFGLAQWEPGDGDPSGEKTRATTQAGTFVGTPGYVSPEQAQALPATPQSDMFSLGVVMHEMLTGRHPFKRPTSFETLTAIVREDPSPLDGVPGLAPGVARVVERCLEKRPAERPGSAADLAFLLETLGARGETPTAATTAVPAAAPPGDPGLARVRRRLLLVSSGSLLLLAAGTWGYVQVMAGRIVGEAVAADLARAATIVRRVHDDRLSRLGLTARLVASSPELKALLATDTTTIRDQLLETQQRHAGGGVLLVFGTGGELIARTDTATPSGDETWLTALLRARDRASVVTLGGRPYHAAAAESEARGTTFGYVVAALAVDGSFARSLAEATRDDVVLLGEAQALGTTLRDGQSPWRSIAAWHGQGGQAESSVRADVGGRAVSVREVPLQREPAVSVMLVTSDDEAIEPYRRMQRGTAAIGALALLLAVAGILWAARTGPGAPTHAQRL